MLPRKTVWWESWVRRCDGPADQNEDLKQGQYVLEPGSSWLLLPAVMTRRAGGRCCCCGGWVKSDQWLGKGKRRKACCAKSELVPGEQVGDGR